MREKSTRRTALVANRDVRRGAGWRESKTRKDANQRSTEARYKIERETAQMMMTIARIELGGIL